VLTARLQSASATLVALAVRAQNERRTSLNLDPASRIGFRAEENCGGQSSLGPEAATFAQFPATVSAL